MLRWSGSRTAITMNLWVGASGARITQQTTCDAFRSGTAATARLTAPVVLMKTQRFTAKSGKMLKLLTYARENDHEVSLFNYDLCVFDGFLLYGWVHPVMHVYDTYIICT